MPVLQATADSDQSVSEAVIEAVAEAEDISSTAVAPPLYEAIDPDALDAVCRSLERSASGPGDVTFAYAGYTVTVRGGGRIVLRSRQESTGESLSR